MIRMTPKYKKDQRLSINGEKYKVLGIDGGYLEGEIEIEYELLNRVDSTRIKKTERELSRLEVIEM